MADMSEVVKVKGPPMRRVDHPDDRPKLGEFFWVKDRDEKKEKEWLMCVVHLASNHVMFATNSPGGGKSLRQVRYRDLMRDTRPELNWKAEIQKEIDGCNAKLKAAVMALADVLKGSDLLANGSEPESMLPAVVRQSPEEQKKQLTEIMSKTAPDAQKRIRDITEEMIAWNADLYLPLLTEGDRMMKVCGGIKDRLFALELYAGIKEHCEQIAKGAPAPMETPIHMRQMLRYMDEESLIDYQFGGMDFTKIEKFDEWIAKPTNFKRLCPEPRCIVALQVRRDRKDYGSALSTVVAFGQWEKHKANEWTYLLVRNGDQLFRLYMQIEFSPRLLPLRNEFVKPFTERRWRGGDDTREIQIGPDDLDYDDKVAERKAKIVEYNRVMFLVQGLLDRSKVFKPHPPINLSNPDDSARWLIPVFDEEIGLPSANPPSWEGYRDAANQKLKIGSHVFTGFAEDKKDDGGDYRRRFHSHNRNGRPTVAEVTSVRRNRTTKQISQVRVSWPWGTRWGYQNRSSRGSGYWGKYGEWPVDRKCHSWIKVEQVFHVDAYAPGDFKQFLCDAYLKGAYLKWSPALLTAEDWHAKKRTDQKKDKKE